MSIVFSCVTLGQDFWAGALDPLPEILENDEAAAGLAYMRQTVQGVREDGERRVESAGEGARFVTYRAATI